MVAPKSCPGKSEFFLLQIWGSEIQTSRVESWVRKNKAALCARAEDPHRMTEYTDTQRASVTCSSGHGKEVWNRVMKPGTNKFFCPW